MTALLGEKEEAGDERDQTAEKRTLEVESGTVISITTNTTDGYVLSVQSLPSPVFTVLKVELKESGSHFSLPPTVTLQFIFPMMARTAIH